MKYIIQSFVLEPGVYNLGSDDYQTVLQTAHDIAEYFGVGIKKLSDKPEGMTLPFMENNKLISASNINFSVNQSSHMKNYLDQLNASL